MVIVTTIIGSSCVLYAPELTTILTDPRRGSFQRISIFISKLGGPICVWKEYEKGFHFF